MLFKEISHFTIKEAEKRDEIVLSYFGENGVNKIIDSIIAGPNAHPNLKPNAKVLDIGAGSGFFTIRIASKVRKLVPAASLYAMDATPAMLSALAKKRKTSVHSLE